MIWSHSNRMHWTNNELGVTVDVLQDDEGQWLLTIAGTIHKFNNPLDAMHATKGLVEQYNEQKEKARSEAETLKTEVQSESSPSL